MFDWAGEAPSGMPLRLVIHVDSAPASDEQRLGRTGLEVIGLGSDAKH